MSQYQCPRCRSDRVRAGRIGFDGFSLLEMGCPVCHLFESRRSDAPDVEAWLARWTAAAPAVATTAVEPPVAAQADVDPDLAGVTAAPRDDAPRLAYAARIEGAQPERAELIRLQVARGSLGTPGVRERALVRAHGAAWAGPVAPLARAVTQPISDPGWAFDRGFVAWIRIAAAALRELDVRLFQLAPIEHLDVVGTGAGDPALRAALGAPLLGRLRSLGLPGCGLDDDDTAALAANPRLAGLRWLDLRDNGIGARGMATLAASPTIRAIPVVLLGGNPGDPSEQYSFDGDGSVADSWLPAAGEALERAHGRIGWLHLPPPGARPARFAS